MKVDVVRLRMASDRLWNHLEELGIESVDIPYDYYWSVPEPQVYQLENAPTQHEVGQLTDDWQVMLRLTERDGDVISYDFVRLAALLRVLGEVLVS
jgi:hypothetical protein